MSAPLSGALHRSGGRGSSAIAGMGVSLEVDTMISEGDKVVAMCRMTGVHQADFMGVAASGQTINVGTAEQFRFEDGKVVEH